eukprot:2049907-Rhodomonas_salina.3
MLPVSATAHPLQSEYCDLNTRTLALAAVPESKTIVLNPGRQLTDRESPERARGHSQEPGTSIPLFRTAHRIAGP